MVKEIKTACKGADLLPIDKLINFQGDLKKITPENMQKLKNNIIKNNFSAPIFIWKKSDKSKAYILDGHSRVKALLELQKEGYKIPAKLPIDYIKAINKKEAKEKLLGIASQYGIITEAGLMDFIDEADLDVDSLLNTVEIPNVDIVFPEEETVDDDEIPEKVKTITKMGDLWELGKHRVLCGDSTDAKQIEKLMARQKADMVFTDPPYGINAVNVKTKKTGGGGETKFKGKIGGVNIVDSKEYYEIRGDDSTETTKRFYQICKNLKYKNIVLWGGNYYTDFLPISRCWFIWDKEMTGNFSEAEMAWTSFQKGGIKVFKYLWNGLSREGNRTDELLKRVHPTQKPVGLFENIFRRFNSYKTILDPFLGSGSTLIACEKTNRICYGMEIEPHYCNVTVQRYKDWCKQNKREINIKLNGKKWKE